MKKYVDYIIDTTFQLLEIDSPTGYTKRAAEFVMEEYKKMGYDAAKESASCTRTYVFSRRYAMSPKTDKRKPRSSPR